MPVRMRTTAKGMLRKNTPTYDYTEEYGFHVKREDLSCPAPGPPFSKTRGVYAHLANTPQEVIGVLDTYHSQAGHAVARACQILGKRCLNFYPVYKATPTEIREPQKLAHQLGAELIGIPAGRSCILYHHARKYVEKRDGYMMPNALKLRESITETAKEVGETHYDTVIIPASSGTIAAGVLKGFYDREIPVGRFIIHLGYSRPEPALRKYLARSTGIPTDLLDADVMVVDEGYSYKDVAKPGETPPWPCNSYYDLKAFRWWLANRSRFRNTGKVLFWNIG